LTIKDDQINDSFTYTSTVRDSEGNELADPSFFVTEELYGPQLLHHLITTTQVFTPSQYDFTRLQLLPGIGRLALLKVTPSSTRCSPLTTPAFDFEILD